MEALLVDYLIYGRLVYKTYRVAKYLTHWAEQRLAVLQAWSFKIGYASIVYEGKLR